MCPAMRIPQTSRAGTGKTGEAVEARLGGLLLEKRPRGPLRIGLGGGSGSGKTLIAELIRERLHPSSVAVVKLDRFFKPAEEMPKYWSSHHGEFRPDYNQPDSLRVEEMVAFCRDLAGVDVTVLDGHFSLHYPAMRALMDIRCFVTAGIEEMLERRTRRNVTANYGGGLETILHYNRECVLPSYERYIRPTREHADLLIPNGAGEEAERDRLLELLCGRIRTHLEARTRRAGPS